MERKLSLKRREVLAGAAAAAAAPLAIAAKPGSDEIVIGQSTHLSGPLSPTFVPVIKGQELAIAELNRKGGIAGRKVRLITYDDAYDPKKCFENVTRLIERDNVTALYGLANTGNVAAVLPLLAEKKVPLIGVYTGSPVLRAKHHPYFFTTMASYQDEVVQMLRNLAVLQRKDVALVYQNSPFGQLMLPVVEAAAKQAGINIVAKAPLEANGSDAVQAAQTLGDSHPAAVMFMAFGPSMVPFVRAAKAHIGAPIYCISISNAQAVLDALGEDARGLAFAQLIPFPWRAVSPVARDFQAAMTQAKLQVDYGYFFGYLSLRVLFEGLRRSGKNPTSQSLTTAMETMQRTDIGGYTVDYSPTNHHGSKFVEMTIYGPGGRWLR